MIFIVAGAHRADPQSRRRVRCSAARIPRGLAVLAVYLAFFLTLPAIGFLLANPISDQVRTFTDNLPHLVNEANKNARELPG